MQDSLLKPCFPLLLAVLAACGSSGIDREGIAGLYGCDPCFVSGSTLYLRQDGTYSRCTFSDIPEFDGHFAKEEQGTYTLDGRQLTLQPESSDASSKRFVLRIRNRLYMISEDEYENFQKDYDVIGDIGLTRRPVTTDNPYTCEAGGAVQG